MLSCHVQQNDGPGTDYNDFAGEAEHWPWSVTTMLVLRSSFGVTNMMRLNEVMEERIRVRSRCSYFRMEW